MVQKRKRFALKYYLRYIFTTQHVHYFTKTKKKTKHHSERRLNDFA